jgi:hypothetical protein
MLLITNNDNEKQIIKNYIYFWELLNKELKD